MKRWTREYQERVEELYSDHTYEEIAKILQKEFGIKKSADAVRKLYKKYTKSKEKLRKLNLPKVLVFDIETAPMLGRIWKLWDNNLSLSQVESDWHLLSWSAKWLGDPPDKVMYMDQRNAKNIEDDTELLEELWKLLDKADMTLTQNGVAFDHKKINARFILKGFQPPSSCKQIDTKKIAKKHFGFTSNSLEYMTSNLCKKFKKSTHAKYSGYSMWKECLAGNIEAWNEMEMYNKLDVLSLEELYVEHFAAWDNSINFNVLHDKNATVCTCGNTEFRKAGFHYTKTNKFQKYKCTDCGYEIRDRQGSHTPKKTKKLKTT